MRIGWVTIGSAISFFALTLAAHAQATGCAPGTKCLTVATNGGSGSGFTAQCTGMFPDFVFSSSAIPSGFAGPWFQLSQNYPATVKAGDAPCLKIDFRKGMKEANEYLYVLRDYSFEGMIEAGFVPQKNNVRQWYHMPMMNYGNGRREPIHGLTQERPVTGPELGVKQ